MVLSNRTFSLLIALVVSFIIITLFEPLIMTISLISLTLLGGILTLWQHPDLGRMAVKLLAELVGLMLTLGFFIGLLVVTYLVIQP